MWIVAGDVLVNLDQCVAVCVTQDNVLEFTYSSGQVTQVRYGDYGGALTALKQVIGKLGIDVDLGGELDNE